MFIDEVEITVKAGHGGAGKVSFYAPPMKGPDGGNGGRGGDIYFKTTSDLTALKQFTAKKFIQGNNGENGGSNRKFGKDGQAIEITIPAGCLIKIMGTDQEIELANPGEKILIAKGGLGGRGNFEFKSPRNTTPKTAQPGLEGEEKKLQIILRLIADFGLIGLPNAGKSSLLNELTSTSVKVANYPFTTLEPNLGVFNGKVLADIPGLIEGASSGKGLGIKFLKHIEKTQVLLHCLAADSENLLKDYQTVRDELEKYSERSSSANKDLLNKKEIILITKSDLVDKQKLKEISEIFKRKKKKVLPISIYNWDEMEKLKKLLS